MTRSQATTSRDVQGKWALNEVQRGAARNAICDFASAYLYPISRLRWRKYRGGEEVNFASVVDAI